MGFIPFQSTKKQKHPQEEELGNVQNALNVFKKELEDTQALLDEKTKKLSILNAQIEILEDESDKKRHDLSEQHEKTVTEYEEKIEGLKKNIRHFDDILEGFKLDVSNQEKLIQEKKLELEDVKSRIPTLEKKAIEFENDFNTRMLSAEEEILQQQKKLAKIKAEIEEANSELKSLNIEKDIAIKFASEASEKQKEYQRTSDDLESLRVKHSAMLSDFGKDQEEYDKFKINLNSKISDFEAREALVNKKEKEVQEIEKRLDIKTKNIVQIVNESQVDEKTRARIKAMSS